MEKELILYKTFSRMNPRSVENYGRVLANAEEEFTAIIKEREETKTDHRTGLRHIAKHLILYVASGEEEIFIELHEDLLKYQDEHLLNAVYHITVHLNFLEGGEHDKNSHLPEDGKFMLRAYTPKELRSIYGVSAKCFSSWLKPFEAQIGPLLGKQYTVAQVKTILEKLGIPGVIDL